MCLTPIRITNPTRTYKKGFTKPILYVPCGHCKECIERNQDDWFVRSVFESERGRSKGGAVWFPTFTFDNSHLHWYHDHKRDFHCPCFDVIDFKRFRDKLRTNLMRDKKKGLIDIPDPSGDNTIRFIYCCEYGGKKGRSHYHALVYIPFRLKPSYVKRLFDKCWSNGFVMWSKQGMMAQSLRAAQYCMKYISKEMLWLKQYGIDDYIQSLKDEIYSPSSTDEEISDARETLKEFRRVCPGHKQSLGFGVDGLKYFTNPDGTWNIARLVKGTMSKAKLGIPPKDGDTEFNFNMPLYYVRKIFYDVDDYNMYRLNGVGKQVFTLRFDLALKRDCQKYAPYFGSYSELCDHLAPLALNNCEFVHKWFLSLLGTERTVHDLAVFNKVYRDIPINEDNCPPVGSVRDTLDILNDNALDFMLVQKDLPDDEYEELLIKYPHKFVDRSRSADAEEHGFNNLPCYDGFVTMLNKIESYEEQLGRLEQSAYEFKRIQDENLFGSKSVNYTTDYLFQDF